MNCCPAWSCGQHCIPDSRRSSIFEAKSAEVKLAITDPVQQFDPADNDRSGAKPFETEHRANASHHALWSRPA
jgi:hypothetical protein